MKPLSPEDEYCQDLFATTHSRDKKGRFIVRLPFARKPIPSDSRDVAVACLIRAESKLKRNSQLEEAYHKFIEEYLDLHHMEIVAESEKRVPSYYMPHHAVTRQQSPTKIIVVFNASKKSSLGLSLNDFLLTGPKLQSDITLILSR